MTEDKVIIVEGKTDKQCLLKVLDEPVFILCTFGTLSDEKLEEHILPLADRDVYVLVDADEAGNRLRRILKRELPNARHLYTRKRYREVARSPLEYIARLLYDAHFDVKPAFLVRDDRYI